MIQDNFQQPATQDRHMVVAGVDGTAARGPVVGLRMAVHAVFVMGIIPLLTGCCTFERDWNSAQSYANSGDDIAGCWEGTWQSDVDGHHGKLRAIITRQGESYYQAHFKATYAKIVPFSFDVPLTVTNDTGLLLFEGQADLGFLAGGTYTYTGQATPSDFTASYCAQKDQGTFTMSRIVSCVQCCDESQFSEIQQCVSAASEIDDPSTSSLALHQEIPDRSVAGE